MKQTKQAPAEGSVEALQARIRTVYEWKMRI